MISPLISVIICSHNPRQDYLLRVLDALRLQTLDHLSWELIVVDNKSDPPINDKSLLNWHPYAKIITEYNLGLTHARLSGIKNASGQLFVFVDDDNLLFPDYLAEAKRISEQLPFLGSWSGQCYGEFETPPPPWIERYSGNLVIRQFSDDRWSNLPRLAETMPCGAGLCVRRSVALKYLETITNGGRRFDYDRKGTSLLSGGDNDLAACSCDIGLGVGLISSLKLTHLIPAQKVNINYISRLAYGTTYSGILLDHERGANPVHKSNLRLLFDFARLLLLDPLSRKVQLSVLRAQLNAKKVLVPQSDHKRISEIGEHSVYMPGLKDDGLVIDAGANRGAFGAAVKQISRQNVVFIEANPILAESLRKRFDCVFNLGLSHCTGVSSFNIGANDETSSLNSPLHENALLSVKRVINIKLETLENIIESAGMHLPIRCVKLDIEGAEVDVLNSLAPKAKSICPMWTVEFHDHPQFGGISSRDAVSRTIKNMRSNGFSVLTRNYPSRTNVLFLDRSSLEIGILEWLMILLRYQWFAYAWRLANGIKS